MDHNLSVYQITGSRSAYQAHQTAQGGPGPLPWLGAVLSLAVFLPRSPDRWREEGGHYRTLQAVRDHSAVSGLHTGDQNKLAPVKYPTAFSACKHLSMHKIKIK